MSKKKKKFKKFRVKARINRELQEMRREERPTIAPIAKVHEKTSQKTTQKETPSSTVNSDTIRYIFTDLKKLAIVNALVFGLLATVTIINLKTDLVLKTSEFILKVLKIQ